MNLEHCDILEGYDWKAVDFDSTLATYEHGGVGDHPLKLGQPIAPMVSQVRTWLAQGDKVCIFTARLARDNSPTVLLTKQAIKTWCGRHLGQVLPVTCIKQHVISHIYDDKAYHVVPNTGVIYEP